MDAEDVVMAPAEPTVDERNIPDEHVLTTSSENVNNENREKELQQDVEPSSPPSPPAFRSPDEHQQSATANKEEDEYSKHLTYNSAGIAIYTDPSTRFQYEFDTEKNDWVPVSEANKLAEDPYENEHYRWCHETNKWIPKSAADETENEFYKFDPIKREWIPKASTNLVRTIMTEAGEEQHTYTDVDGVDFIWDSAKNAWFPKIDDDFMAKYQMGYGCYVESRKDSVEDVEEFDSEDEDEKLEQVVKNVVAAKVGAKRKAQPEPPSKISVYLQMRTKI